MGSQGGVCNTNNNGGIQAQNQILTHDPVSDPLARQGSLYSLTLDEVENQLGDLGKPLSNMNLDELLKTVWTAEANNNQAVENVNSGPSSSSLIMSMDLSKRTVDAVWQGIQEEQKQSILDRKTTLGEMTLEDFLVKAGVVAESTSKKVSTLVQVAADPMAMNQHAQWVNYQMPLVHSQPQQQCMLPVFVPNHPVQPATPHGGITDGAAAAYPETQMTMCSSPVMGTLSDTQAPGRKRVAPDDIAERSVERRQKRMIKNRESAARSRARKQAYTHELENKVSRLEEEIERLKRQKEVEKVLPSTPPPEPKYQLRRTSSAPI